MNLETARQIKREHMKTAHGLKPPGQARVDKECLDVAWEIVAEKRGYDDSAALAAEVGKTFNNVKNADHAPPITQMSVGKSFDWKPLVTSSTRSSTPTSKYAIPTVNTQKKFLRLNAAACSIIGNPEFVKFMIDGNYMAVVPAKAGEAGAKKLHAKKRNGNSGVVSFMPENKKLGLHDKRGKRIWHPDVLTIDSKKSLVFDMKNPVNWQGGDA